MLVENFLALSKKSNMKFEKSFSDKPVKYVAVSKLLTKNYGCFDRPKMSAQDLPPLENPGLWLIYERIKPGFSVNYRQLYNVTVTILIFRFKVNYGYNNHFYAFVTLKN